MCGYTFHLEHIIPVALSGSNEAGNRALACSPCNLAKGTATHALDLATGQMVPLFDPRQDDWARHFEAEPETGRLRPRDAVGRATIEALQINDDARIATRRLWAVAGWWP